MKRVTIIMIVIALTPTMVQAGIQDLIEQVHPNIPPRRAKRLVSHTKSLCEEYNVPADVVFAIMWNETDFVNKKSDVDTDPASAGYMQVLETTADSMLGREVGWELLVVNWRLGVELGVRFFALQYHRHDNLTKAVGRYNGINNQPYVDDVLEKLKTVEKYIKGGN